MPNDPIKRALEIVRAIEWSGDMRANMTQVIGAGRVLAKRNEELEADARRWDFVLEGIRVDGSSTGDYWNTFIEAAEGESFTEAVDRAIIEQEASDAE